MREYSDDPPISLSVSAVTFTNPTRVAIDLTEAIGKGMDAGAIYQLVYQAENPYVGGVGFVSVRDLVSYLRNELVDGAGNANRRVATARQSSRPTAGAGRRAGDS